MPLKCCLVFGIFALFTVCLPTVFCEQVFVKIEDSLDAVVSCKETISTLTVKIHNFMTTGQPGVRAKRRTFLMVEHENVRVQIESKF